MRYLLPDTKKYYKANLHTHSTVSDGKLTPEEVKAEYKKLGYSILALTDHSVIVNHQHLNDPDFLMLTGAEISWAVTFHAVAVPKLMATAIRNTWMIRFIPEFVSP